MSTLAGHATETCSRTAIINYQEILVDTNSTQKGEGLRYYIEKDAIAKSYLDKYQKRTKIQWPNVVLGTAGTIMTLSGFLVNKESNNRRALIIGGLTMLTINFLVARTIAYNNEQNLHEAIKEYNKRNLPRIYFNPWHDSKKKFFNTQGKMSPAIIINIARSF